MDKSPQIFLSYAKEDKTQVDRIYELLRFSGLTPWMDKPPAPYQFDGIQPGERWDDCIRREMNASDFVFAFLSNVSIAKKGYVQREYKLALHLLEDFPVGEIFLIPVLLDECELPDLRVATTSLRDLQYFNFKEGGIEPLVQFIKRKKGLVPEAESRISAEYPEVVLPVDLFKAPLVIWSAFVGAQKWKNTPICCDNAIYVGSAGSKWNEPDEDDGIYAIHPEDGSYRWFLPTGSDVNELLVTDELVVAGVDDGYVWCCDRFSGADVWKVSLGAGVLHPPIVVRDSRIVVITYEGLAVLLDSASGQKITELNLDGHFIANPVLDVQKGHIIAPSIEGVIFIVDISSEKLTLVKRCELLHVGFDGRFEPPELYCSPVKFGDIWIQGFVRETSFSNPAFMALDLETDGDPVVWYASDSSYKNDGHGNIRATPLIVDESIIFGSPYSQEIMGLDANNGNLLWRTILGMPMFPHWSSPVANDRSIFLPRHDGYLYEIDRISHEKNWSLYLGKKQFAGIQEQMVDFDLEGNPTSRFSESGNWEPLFGSPIFSTPCLDESGKVLYVGTDEGFLYRMDLQDTPKPINS